MDFDDIPPGNIIFPAEKLSVRKTPLNKLLDTFTTKTNRTIILNQPTSVLAVISCLLHTY